MGWYILLGLLALVLVLLLLPIRVLAVYVGGACRVWIRYLWLQIPLYPRPPKGKKQGQKKKREKTPPPAEGEKKQKKVPLSQTVEIILLAIRSALRPLEKLAGRIRFSVWLELIISQEEAMDTALGYGRAHWTVSAAFAALSNFFRIRLRRVWIRPDFLRQEGDAWARVQVAFAPWMALAAALSFGFHFIKGFLQRQSRQNPPPKAGSPPPKGHGKGDRPPRRDSRPGPEPVIPSGGNSR